MFISVEKLKESEARFVRPKSPNIATQLMAEDAPKWESGSKIISKKENLDKRKDMLRASSLEPLEFSYERTIGKNDSVYSNFCELIISAKQKVGRIALKKGIKPVGYATGFMVSDRLLLTNHHVFQTKESVDDSVVEFVYELDIFGRSTQKIVFKLSPEEFYHSNEKLDYCFVAVSPFDLSGNTPLTDIGYHFLDPTIGKLGEEGKEYLNIIHHPDGDYKQLSIRENRFTKIQPQTIWYESDTAQGSSGSPVFNDQWQVVALHHMGVAQKSADGLNYIDKKGKVIEKVNGKIDASRVQWIANEGIRTSVILKDIFQNLLGNIFVENLKTKPNPGTNTTKNNSKSAEEFSSTANNSDSINISIPSKLIVSIGGFQISIGKQNLNEIAKLSGDQNHSEFIVDDFSEISRIDRANAIDYSDCKGYQSKFLGVDIPIPKPKKAIQKFVTKLKSGNKTILNYYHYSVIHHKVRMMPIISAINIDGDPAKRLDKTERKDIWLIDNRLDLKVQLDNPYYAGSGFARGHMSRREDANWGPTPQLAKLYADMTCVHTNACPQVAALNGGGGLWGQLEKIVLEKGATKEKGKTAKISVFNGPIFNSSDKSYKGIQVPMEFWKLILWYNDVKKLCATAFILSQKDLVSGIDLEVLDFNSNSKFHQYQSSIKDLEKLTKIDFSHIWKYDTFDESLGDESIKINSERELVSLIKKNSPKKK